MNQPEQQLEHYLVGGAVRDELLGLAIKDRDYVVIGATPEKLTKLGFNQVGADFPCFLHPETKEEYALARTERKSGRGYTGFICDFAPEITLEQDLFRRDLTINAIAKDRTGQIIDPYGGLADLKSKTLRHVSDAFVEDPLRVLRVARFAARLAPMGFSVHPETQKLMRSLAASGELDHLTAERVWAETQRALTENKPSEYFLVLRECGALKVLFPEVEALFGVPQTATHHPEIDTGAHVLMALDRTIDHHSAAIAWAVLLHDLGKALTPKTQWPRHLCHESTGVPLVKAVCDRFKVPKEFTRLAVLTCEHHLRCHRVAEMKPGKILNLIESLDGIRRPESVEMFAKACRADANGRQGFAQREYPQADLLVSCTQAVKQVSVQPLLERGLRGAKLIEPLRQLRTRAITEARANFGDV